MPITIKLGGKGGRSQFNEWTGPTPTDPSLGSFARNNLNAVPYPLPGPFNLTYVSADVNVATVDDDGNVTAVGPGETFITAIDNDNGLRATDRVTVVYPNPAVAATLNLINDQENLNGQSDSANESRQSRGGSTSSERNGATELTRGRMEERSSRRRAG